MHANSPLSSATWATEAFLKLFLWPQDFYDRTPKKGPRGLSLADGHDGRTGMCPARGHRGPAPAEGRGQGAHGAGVRVVEPARAAVDLVVMQVPSAAGKCQLAGLVDITEIDLAVVLRSACAVYPCDAARARDRDMDIRDRSGGGSPSTRHTTARSEARAGQSPSAS